MIRRTPALRRVLVPVSATAVLLAVVALPASAHVEVSSPDATPGGFGTLVFRVPTESDTASTTSLTVTMPRRTAFAFVSSRPLPGWTVATTQRRLSAPLKVEGFTLTKVVATVTWTAARGSGIEPGQFDEFELSVGPFPTTGSTVSLPVRQGYSDGTTVDWDQPSPKGKPEPEHPVPTLEPAGPKGGSSTDAVGRWMGGGGLLLGAVALAVALARGRWPRRPATEPR